MFREVDINFSVVVGYFLGEIGVVYVVGYLFDVDVICVVYYCGQYVWFVGNEVIG